MNGSKTAWQKIVTGKDLVAAKRFRSKEYIVRKERTLALPDFVEEGWTKYREYKNPKFVGIKNQKILTRSLKTRFGCFFQTWDLRI